MTSWDWKTFDRVHTDQIRTSGQHGRLDIPWNSNGRRASTSDAPPSTSINCPVIQAASCEQINATALPMSAGVPNRPIGVQPRSCHSRKPVWKASGRLFSTLSSGLIVFTVMPRRASATAKYRTSTSKTALAALCGGSVDSRAIFLNTKLFFLKPGRGTVHTRSKRSGFGTCRALRELSLSVLYWHG
jgi:hypothetical protein